MYYKIIICHKNQSQMKNNQILAILIFCSYCYKIVSSIIHESLIAACNIHHVMIYIFQGWLSLILFRGPYCFYVKTCLKLFFAFPFTYWEWDTEICKYLKAIKYSISMSLQHFKRIRNN